MFKNALLIDARCSCWLWRSGLAARAGVSGPVPAAALGSVTARTRSGSSWRSLCEHAGRGLRALPEAAPGDTGRKLAHLERQLRSGESISDELARAPPGVEPWTAIWNVQSEPSRRRTNRSASRALESLARPDPNRSNLPPRGTSSRDIDARDRLTREADGPRSSARALLPRRPTQRALLGDLGRFRTVAVEDLATHLYGGRARPLRQDLAALRAQGLDPNALRLDGTTQPNLSSRGPHQAGQRAA